MSEFLKKPYEISIWKDKLVGEGANAYFDEEKIAIIGSDDMTSPNRAFSPKLTKNVNGEVTFTFSIAHRYFDNDRGEVVFNPFTVYLVNERKVKLYYDGQWYDFIIKNCEESSESDTFTYTCTDLWINELSKTGYNVELAQELANNQGTVLELAQKVVETTDWEIDTDNSDIIRQWVQEPLYKGTLTSVPANVIDVLGNGSALPLTVGETVYFFYSEIINEKEADVTIMRALDNENGKWVFDDNNVAKGPNYRIAEVNYTGENHCPDFINSRTFSENLEFQGYRLNYAPRSKYDPVTEKYVDIWKAVDLNKTIYHYKESEYVTSDILFNAVTNGSGFNIYSDGNLTTPIGWGAFGGKNSTVKVTADTDHKRPQKNNIEFGVMYRDITKDPIPNSASRIDLLTELKTLEQVEDCDAVLVLDFNRPFDNFQSYIFNSGIEDNRSLIGGFLKGEKYVARIKYGINPSNVTEHGGGGHPELGLIVAEYTLNKNEDGTTAWYEIDKNKIYFDLRSVNNGTQAEPNWNYKIKNNTITGGEFIVTDGKKTGYKKAMSWGEDILPPSRKYVYYAEGSDTAYVWSSERGEYVAKGSQYDPQPGINSWYCVGECLQPLSEEDIMNKNIGIFFTSDTRGTFFVREAEFFKYRKDANNQMLLLGSAPEATENTLNYYYVYDENINDGNKVKLYTDLTVLSADLGGATITQVYNDNCEQIGSIEVQESNYFNIIQELCEKFQCWAKFHVKHEENGKIKLDGNNNPIKKITFHEYVGKENFAGFKYGINLSSIQRTLDSNEFVSKLIVAQNDNEYVDGGVLTIRKADANSLGESYILNFSYYLNHGLIDSQDFYDTYQEFQSQIKQLNIELNELNQKYQDTQAAVIRIDGVLDVYREAIYEAILFQAEGEKDITEVTGAASYNAYINSPNRNDEADESVADYLAKVLTGSNVESGYSGITSELQDERTRLAEQADGRQEYLITITCSDNQTIASINDFIGGVTITLSDGEQTPSTRVAKFDSVNKVCSWTDFIVSGTLYSATITLSSDMVAKYTLCDINRNPLQSNVVSLDPSTSIGFYLVPKEQDNTNYKAQINTKKAEKDALEKEFFKKYGRYIQEGTWTSDDYVDNNLYYLDALNVSNTSAQPKVTYTINVVEVSELEGLSNYLFDVGDKTYMEDIEFFGWTQNGLKTPIREEVVVSEVAWNLDSPEENAITVQNYKTQFEDLFQRIGAAVQSIEYKEGAYNRAASMLDSNGLINSSLLTASLNNISGSKFGVSAVGSVYTDRDGIVVTDILKTVNQMKLSAKGLMVSNDAGVTWRTIVSPDGIDISYIKAGIIDAGKINIMDGENTSFRWDKNGISAYQFSQVSKYIPTDDETVVIGKTYYIYDSDNDKYDKVEQPTGNPKESNYYEYQEIDTTYDMSTYVRFDKYGLYGIKNNKNFIARSPDDVQQNASFGITWQGFFIKNSYTNGYVSITEDDDIKVVKIVEVPGSDDQEITKIKIGALEKDENEEPIRYGISIRNDHDLEVFKTDDDGNAVFNNVSIKGSIKASVFEYEEIQAIGGILVVRPSSTIKDVVGPYYDTTASTESGGDLPFIGTEIILENPDLFRNKDRCKLGSNGNYYTLLEDKVVAGYEKTNDTDINTNKDYYVAVDVYVLTEDTEPIEGKTYYIDSTSYDYEEVAIDEGDNPANLGWFELTTAYQLVYSPVIENINDYYETITENHWILQNFNAEETDYIEYEDLIGSALVAMAHPEFDGVNTIITDNYGIAINSSNSDVQAPQRAITLFETYGETDAPGEITGGEHFSYRGVLGTLPSFSDQETDKVADIYNAYMANTQGVYTDNMYIGNGNEYVAFYTDDMSQKHLAIKATDLQLETGSVNEGLLSISNRISALENEDHTVKNLRIDPSQIILYNTENNNDLVDTNITTGLKLTAERLQFITDVPLNTAQNPRYVNDYNTWIDKESLNTKEIYFQTAYPRIFDMYELSKDETVNPNKTYYSYDNAGNYYEIIQPTGSPVEQSYYEKTSQLSSNSVGNLMFYTRSNGHFTIKNIK